MGQIGTRAVWHGGTVTAAIAGCLLVGSLLALSACSSSKKPSTGSVGAPAGGSPLAVTATVDPRSRPAAVPTSADQARAQVELGAASGGGDAERLSSMSCADGLLTIKTTQHVVYAELPCDRALPDDNVKPFVDQPIHVRSVPANPAKLYLDSSAAGSIEFTVGRVWVTSS